VSGWFFDLKIPWEIQQEYRHIIGENMGCIESGCNGNVCINIYILYYIILYHIYIKIYVYMYTYMYMYIVYVYVYVYV
jgi:hypothetical protein